MSEPKTYVPKSSVKETVFPDGGKLLKIGFHAETLAEFVKNHANEKGYVNFVITRRREVGQFGETHSVTLDTWKPDGRASGRATNAAEGQQTEAQRLLAERRGKSAPASEEPDDDVPF
jgi:hypothetical protein